MCTITGGTLVFIIIIVVFIVIIVVFRKLEGVQMDICVGEIKKYKLLDPYGKVAA